VFILALLAVSALAGASNAGFGSPAPAKPAAPAEGKTSDDWHADTDITATETSYHSANRLDDGQQYQLQEGEEFVGSETTVTDGVAGVWRNTTENKLEMKDGNLVNTTYTRRTWVDSHRKVQKVRKIIHTPVTIASVYEVVKAFSEEYGSPLSALEFQLFNTIAVTEGNHFHMRYAVRQIKRVELPATIRKLIKIFSVPLCEDDIAAWVNEIDQNCNDAKYKVFPLDTTNVEIHRENKWLIRTEVLMATCGQEKNAGFQLFAWAAHKEGAYRAGQYSVENSHTVDGLVTRWLYANMRSMIDCERTNVAQCDNEESSTLSEFSLTRTERVHVAGGDRWQEHANGGAGATMESESTNEPNQAMSDKGVWNRNSKP
jgi:hypothetical protein